MGFMAEVPGTACPILLRLENQGWVTSRWEDVDRRAEKRPARRYYRLTASGAVQASASVANARRPLRSAPRLVVLMWAGELGRRVRRPR
jgi:PadR family transcriptional regulator PadR